MAVFRVNKTKNFTVMSNYHLRDKTITFKAKGLLSVILSLPDDWNYSINGIVAISKESRTAVVNTLKELIDAGYVTVTKINSDETGRFEYVYDIYEKPHEIATPDSKNPDMENPYLDNPYMGNQQELNTKEQNTKEINTYIRGRLKPPTLEEVSDYCQERGNNINPQQFIDYYASQNWKKANGRPVADWKACVRTWERKEKEQPKKARLQDRHDYDYDKIERELFGNE